ncbi:MAG: hypothetical protein KA712_15365 [Myxococcales bacterium]|nr:hypothetical protein [Myxococcales bacterium]
MATNHYDAVVCGEDLAGLITAAILGRRGLRVLLLGHDKVPLRITAGPYVLPATPGLLPPPDSEPIERVFRELNELPIVRRRAPAQLPGLQLATGTARIDLGPKDGPVLSQVEALFPEALSAFEAALSNLALVNTRLDPILGSDLTLPPAGFWERREVARFQGQLPRNDTDLLAPLPQQHPLRAALTAAAALGCRFAPSDLGQAPMARAIQRGRQGCHQMPGGIADLRGTFLEKLATVSGEVREQAAPVELISKRGRVTAVRLRPRDEVVGLEQLVWAAPLSTLLPLLDEKTTRRVREDAVGVRPACYRYCVVLLVKAAALGPKDGPRIVSVADPKRPLMEDNAIAVTVGAPLRNDGHVPLWVECLVPAAVVQREPAYLSVVRSRLREHVGRLLPDLEQNLLAVASAHDGLAPEVLRGADLATGTYGPLPARPMPAVLNSDLPRSLDLGAIPHRTPFKNLHVANAENLPGLGVEGDFISAWGVARLINGAVRKRMGVVRRAVLLGDA